MQQEEIYYSAKYESGLFLLSDVICKNLFQIYMPNLEWSPSELELEFWALRPCTGLWLHSQVFQYILVQDLVTFGVSAKSVVNITALNSLPHVWLKGENKIIGADAALSPNS